MVGLESRWKEFSSFIWSSGVGEQLTVGSISEQKRPQHHVSILETDQCTKFSSGVEDSAFAG